MRGVITGLIIGGIAFLNSEHGNPTVLFERIAPLLKALADPVRLRLLSLVASHADGEACVCDLNDAFDLSQPTISHHLKVLHEVGLLDRSKRGVWVYYRVRPDVLAPLGQLIADTVGTPNGELAEPILRSQIAHFDIDAAAFRLAIERTNDLTEAKQADAALSSVLKYYGSELNKRRHELLMSASGFDALEWEGKRSREGATARAWLRSKGNSIEGGTSEVQLNIIAQRILGLPAD